MATYGILQETGRSEVFCFINTHLDHVSAEARLQGARMIREFLAPGGRPVILTGDFNEPPDGPVHRELVGEGRPFFDTWRAVHPPGQDDPTQHRFDGRPQGARIDWILATPPFRVRRAAIVADHQDNRYPSDHFPYEVEVDY